MARATVRFADGSKPTVLEAATAGEAMRAAEEYCRRRRMLREVWDDAEARLCGTLLQQDPPPAVLDVELDDVTKADLEPRISELTLKDGQLDARLTTPLAEVFGEFIGKMFTGSGAVNYVEFTLQHEALGQMSVLVQRKEGKTPAELLCSVNAALDAAGVPNAIASAAGRVAALASERDLSVKLLAGSRS